MEIGVATSRQRPETIIALVNVVFLLLIFFLLFGTVVQPELFEVDVPKSTSERRASEAGVTVLLGSDGRLAVLDRAVTLVGLPQALRHRESGAVRAVTLKVDAHTDASLLMRVLEVLRQVGVESLVLVASARVS